MLDMSNAFGSISLRAVEEGVKKYCPRLLTYFRRLYGKGRKLYSSRGVPLGICWSLTQGDPLSPLFFVLGIHDTLVAIEARLNAQAQSDQHLSLQGYMDDLTIRGDVRRIDFQMIAAQLEKIDLTLNPEKSKVLLGKGVMQDVTRYNQCCASLSQQGVVPSNIKSYDQDAATCLGTPVGCTDGKKRELKGVFDRAKDRLPALQGFAKRHNRHRVFRLVFTGLVTHLVRTIRRVGSHRGQHQRLPFQYGDRIHEVCA